MNALKLAKEKLPNLIPLGATSVMYLTSYVFIYGYQFGICPHGSNETYYSCTDMDVYYGTPFSEFTVVLGILGALALFMPKSMYRYWLAVFGVWFIGTLLWMLSITDPQGDRENYRSSAADLSGAVLFLGTLVWLGICYLIAWRKKRKEISISL